MTKREVLDAQETPEVEESPRSRRDLDARSLLDVYATIMI